VYNQEPCYLHPSPRMLTGLIKKNETGGKCCMHIEMRNSCKTLVSQLQVKELLRNLNVGGRMM
jgi:hypothetical protein